MNTKFFYLVFFHSTTECREFFLNFLFVKRNKNFLNFLNFQNFLKFLKSMLETFKLFWSLKFYWRSNSRNYDSFCEVVTWFHLIAYKMVWKFYVIASHPKHYQIKIYEYTCSTHFSTNVPLFSHAFLHSLLKEWLQPEWWFHVNFKKTFFDKLFIFVFSSLNLFCIPVYLYIYTSHISVNLSLPFINSCEN